MFSLQKLYFKLVQHISSKRLNEISRSTVSISVKKDYANSSTVSFCRIVIREDAIPADMMTEASERRQELVGK